MRAMVLSSFGGPHLFERRDIERSTPGVGEILVKVKASGTNPVDAKLRQDGSWANLEPPVVLGYDVAGVVEEVGEGVSEFQPGDEVYYTPRIYGNQYGSYAEYNIVSASIVGLKPHGISFEEAAAIPLAGGTAWEAIVRRLKVQPGQTVLIHGAAGGVGSFAVQFAKSAGARVLATASPENHEALRKLGADVTIDYHTQDASEVALEDSGGKGVDAALEIQGDNLVARTVAGVRPFGRIACILAPTGNLAPLYQKNITLYGVFLTREHNRLNEMRPLFERGEVRSLIDKVLPLKEVGKAHERLDTGHGRGKIILRIDGQ